MPISASSVFLTMLMAQAATSPETRFREAPPVLQTAQTWENIVYPLKLLRRGTLAVSPLHTLAFSEYGNADGVPVVVLHGGPGAGSSASYARFFDPAFYRVILLDQRGCGQSTPLGSREQNTTDDLLADLEKLRSHLGIDRWVVAGNSWGATLALAYAESHPQQCLALSLRGLYVLHGPEHWQLWDGLAQVYPERWRKLLTILTPQERARVLTPANRHQLLQIYSQYVTNTDAQVSLPAARLFMEYDVAGSYMFAKPQSLAPMLADSAHVLASAQIYMHYATHDFFLKAEQLVQNLDRLGNIPVMLVHGRFDTISAPETSYFLLEQVASATLEMVPDGGHSSSEVGIAQAYVRANDRLKVYPAVVRAARKSR